MKYDIGCGNYCRGEIGITLNDKVESTKQLDVYLQKYGFTYNPKANIYKDDIEDMIDYNFDKGSIFLFSHILEHLKYPYSVLEQILKSEPNYIVIIVPNSFHNMADKFDNEHIYSWNNYSFTNFINKITPYNYLNKIYPVIRRSDLLAFIYKPEFEYINKIR